MRDMQRIKTVAGELAEKFGGTPTRPGGAAGNQVSFEAGDLKTAKAQLAWAADNSPGRVERTSPACAWRPILLDEKAYDRPWQTDGHPRRRLRLPLR